MRDKKGKFKKVLFTTNKLVAINIAICIVIMSIFIYSVVKEKSANEILKEAYERGYATYEGGKFVWIEERKAIIP